MPRAKRLVGASLVLVGAMVSPACDPQPSVVRPGLTGIDAGEGTLAEGGLGPGTFTIVVLPDTQFYAAAYPAVFDAQTSWIVVNRDALKIAFVVHEGDIVDSDVAEQWRIAAASMHRLDGLVPYFVTAGNHDYRDGRRETMIDTYFPASGFAVEPWFGGTFEPGRIENNFGIVPVGPGASWLVLSLEFGPRDTVLAWANQILDAHPDLPAVLVTHAYLYLDGSRYDRRGRPDQFFSPFDYALTGSINDGDGLWRGLVARHDNLRLVLSGHAIPLDPLNNPDAAARLTSTRVTGTRCHQIMANYQTCSNVPCPETLGGDGYLRIMRVDVASNRLSVQTYSPYLDLYKTDDANQFDLVLN